MAGCRQAIRRCAPPSRPSWLRRSTMSRSWWWLASNAAIMRRLAPDCHAQSGAFYFPSGADPRGIADVGLKPAGDPSPGLAEDIAPHEKAEMAARLAGPLQPCLWRA